MSADSYPIIVNSNPIPQKPKKNLLKFALLLVLTGVFLIGSWYLIQNKPWKKFTVQEDPTVNQQKTQTHGEVWFGVLELDTTTNTAHLKEEPRITNTDLFTPLVTEKPQPKEGGWAFQVVVENVQGEIIYRSYRVMSIFPREDNPKVWDFGVATPYTPGGIVRIFDLNQNQIFANKI